ncbi:site-specific integrase [Paenibacillus polymyxa]|uniref:tyrosine-type recombinase/integrase n=1 Tax=Paenibacillus polymyxa TaxID=1406 RepID=UPI002AB597CC|nr:site-specific integrase [Paenibacillus polymyxa]MDY8021242.1 site-specific integrase [Paenibacillus polymyxa]
MSAALNNNVVGLHTNRVSESISAYLMKVKRRNENTYYNYEVAIRRFFMWYKNKTLEELKVEDLDILNEQMIRYQAHLLDDYDYGHNYVNALVAPIVKLYEHLSRNRYDVKAEDVRLDKLPDDGESYGELTVREAETMAKLAVKQKKGQEKSAIIRLAYTTSFRKSSLLNIKWSDITKDRSGTVYLVKAVGKGGKAHTRPISEDLYHELLKIKTQPYYQRYNDDYIFHLSKDTIRNMMNTLKEEMHITEDRNVVFHSLRNVAAGYIKETGGDIEEIRDQLNHSDYNSLKHYMHKDTDYLNMAGIRMNEEIEDEILEGLSREELLSLINNQNETVRLILKREAKKMINEKGSK